LRRKTNLKGLAMRKTTRATVKMVHRMVVPGGAQADQQAEEEAAEEQEVAPQKSSGPAVHGPCNLDLSQRLLELERLVAVLVAGKTNVTIVLG
jgi:uncharacterized membrane-anchored protein